MHFLLWLFALTGIGGCIILLILFFLARKLIDVKAEEGANYIASQDRD